MPSAPTSNVGRRVAPGITVAAIGVLLAGCSGGSGSDGDVTVFAAASLADVLDELGDRFTDGTDIEVVLNVAGSSALRLQLDEGARADVFAPADPKQLDRLEIELLDDPVVVAGNALVVAHRSDDAAVEFEDFDDEQLLLGACAPQVPCGAYAQAAWEAIGLEPALDTEEPDVRSVAAKVAEGELDAGVVYATDVLADDRLSARPLPATAAAAVDIVYPVAVLADAARPDDATRYVEFLLGDEARGVFERHGFEVP